MYNSLHTERRLGTPVHFEHELLRRIAHRDAAALKTLYDLYYARLARFLARVVGNANDAVEIINDVFLVVWNGAAAFRGDSSVSTWIFSIAYRKGLRLLARRKPTLQLEDGADPNGDHANGTALDRDIQRALARISPNQRSVVELTYYFGYSYSEIAKIMGCPENTVKTRMFYARRALRALMAHS
jgi:RNA polymerase sigma-70 factor (ECF subfamily)